MDRPLIVRNVYNLSLESYGNEQSQLVAQFPCKIEVDTCFYVSHHFLYSPDVKICCATIWLHNVSRFTMKSLSIALRTPNMTGFVLCGVVNVTIELVEAYPVSEAIFGSQYGIVLMHSHFIQIYSFIARNWWCGIMVFESNSIHIHNVTTSDNDKVGILAKNCTNIHLSSSLVTNTSDGIVIFNGHDITINNITSMYNTYGVLLLESSAVQTVNSNASNNLITGVHVRSTGESHIVNTTLSNNGLHGLYMEMSHSILLESITAADNVFNGVYLYNTSGINLTLFTAVNNFVCAPYWSNAQVFISTSKYISIYDTVVTVDESRSAGSSGELSIQPAVVAIYHSTLNLTRCIFTGNKITAIKAVASNITLTGKLTFSNNTAFTGTAFILLEDSILIPAENCRAHFINNHVTNTGGVFSISNTQTFKTESFCDEDRNIMLYCYVIPIPTSTCFLSMQLHQNSTQNFIFANNSAGRGGDVIYGGHIAYGFDGNTNCMDIFKDISSVPEATLSLISSDPLRVCLCNQSGLPDCMLLVDPTVHSIYPGQTISISAVVVGQDWGTVAGSVYAQFLHQSTLENAIHLAFSQVAHNTSHKSCNFLHYTIFSMNEDSQQTLVLTTQDTNVSDFSDHNTVTLMSWTFERFYQASKPVTETVYYRANPVFVNISLLSCPTGFHIRSSEPFKCDCDKLLQQIPGVQCFIQKQTIHRSGQVWVGMIHDENGTNETLAVSQYSRLNYCRKAASNVTLSEPDPQCNYNRSGTLCGRCQPGLSLALGSPQCLQCSDDYLVLLIPFTLVGPALVAFIKFLDLTVSQGTLNGLVFYANIIQANHDIYLPWRSTHPLSVFIAWLNLDLGVETCFFHRMDAYFKTWLQFVFPLYIWSIVGVIIILSHYSIRLSKMMGNNSVSVLATLFLLSHAKLLRTIITVFSYTTLMTSQENNDYFVSTAVWSADGNINYMNDKHSILLLTALATLVFLWLPYTLLLFLGHWLHRCNFRLFTYFLINIKPFLDAHHGPLKDNHRYWFGTLNLVRAAILMIPAFVPSDHSSIVGISTVVSAALLMFLGSVVYRNSAVALFNMAFYLNLALFATTILYIKTSGGDPAVATVAATTLIGIAFLQFTGLVIFKVVHILKARLKWIRCEGRRQHVDDGWELYEQAALLREMESDTEEQDSESSGSTESLPTY